MYARICIFIQTSLSKASYANRSGFWISRDLTEAPPTALNRLQELEKPRNFISDPTCYIHKASLVHEHLINFFKE